LIIYGGGISEGNIHSYTDLPILLAGGASAGIKGGRHIRYPKDTQIASLYLTLLEKLGITMEKLGETSGRLQLPTA
jgi:hypothetical protein